MPDDPLCAEGLQSKEVAEQLGVHEHTVGKWRRRFVKDRIEGFTDEYRPGRPRTVSDDQVVEAVKAGEMQYTVLQPVAVFAEEAVRQADNFIRNGETGVEMEKQLFDCILITADNVDQMTSPFVLEQ